jgi:hypothetical protein
MVAPFHALLSVDAEGYSRNPDAMLRVLRGAILDVTEKAIGGAGLADAWRDVRVCQSTGDGFLAVLPRDTIPSLIFPFADHLQAALAGAAPGLRAQGLALRLRVALHCGLVDDEDPVTAAIGTATNEVSRLLDSEPVKAALRDSDPLVTLVAMITSAEVFDKFVRGGHTALRPSQFTQVRARVKQFDQPAYLYVPSPSVLEKPDPGHPQPDGGVPGGQSAPGPGCVPGEGTRIKGDKVQNATGNWVQGDLRQNLS